MAKLYFRYGAMGASKTANMLMVRYNYIERGQEVLLLKPSCEKRDGKMIIKSRIGLEAECIYVEEFLKAFLEKPHKYVCILVDEAQFLTEKQVDALASIVDNENIPVICYGLKTDFQSHLFEGSKRLLEIANVIEEIPTICWCGKKAIMNARVIDGKMVDEGSQIFLGGNESYTSLCRKHYRAKNLGKVGR